VLFGLLGPVGAAGTWWVDRSRRTRRRERKQKEFELESQRARYALQTSADEEDAFLRREWPDPRVVLGAISPPSTMLWCRRPSDDDWLRVRFGTADRPAQAQVNRTSRSAALPAQVIRQAPVGLSLNDHRVVGIAGDPAATADTMAWVGLQLAAWHGPDELDIVVIGQQPREYGWLRWIPHAKPAWTTGSIAERVKQLNELLSGRLEHSSRMRSERFGVDTVAILVGMSGLEQRESLERLLAQGPEAGLAFICVERDGRDLSRACSAVLEVSGRAARLRGGGHETTLACEGVPQHEAERAARALAPLLPAGAGGASGLPDSVHYFDLVGEPTPESIRAAWRMPSQPTSVPIGRDGDAQFEVDIALDGPHGVIAGTTGSGKSVVLQTVLAGLALKNPPDRMNFMFVDYKGGASFLQMAELPHVVGFVSNLDETLARRAFAAIDAEMTRRQEVLAAAGAADFLTYQRLRRDNPALAPLSRLVVVVDEFAELKEAIPDVAKDFESVARIGRTLGVNLLLTAQNPSGVITSQIESNMGLRMCLRVA